MSFMTKCFTCLLTLIAVLFANVDLTANSLEILENVFDNLINSKTLSSLTPKSMTWDPNICSHKFLCIFQMSNLYFQTDAPRCQIIIKIKLVNALFIPWTLTLISQSVYSQFVFPVLITGYHSSGTMNQ